MVKEEEYTEIAVKLKRDLVEGLNNVIVPDSILYEIANVLRFTEGFDEDLIKKSLESFIDLEVDIVIPTMEIIELAVKLSYEYKIAVYDAVFIALAKLINGIFVTADKKLYEKVKELNLLSLLASLDEFNIVTSNGKEIN
jgi:predicted nucleic acid-binding protein